MMVFEYLQLRSSGSGGVEPPNSEASTNAPTDLIQEPADNVASTSPSTSSDPHDVPLSNSLTEESPTETTDISATN